MDSPLAPDLARKLDQVRSQIREYGDVRVAFSGGVDSTLLLRLALDAVGKRCLAVTAVSPALPRQEQAQAQQLAQILGADHHLVETHEIDLEDYASNPPDRCYHCKRELFGALRAISAESGDAALLFGANADDADHDYRPGHRAAAELGARAPLLEAGLTKLEIRQASRALGLSTWDKPQLACLASRFPYGVRITRERLAQVEIAEDALRELGFCELRVRFHDEVARLELGADELNRALDPELRAQIAQAIRDAGFRYVCLDLEGFRSGRLNEALESPDRGAAHE